MSLDIGKRIKELRTEKNLTLRELGEKTGLSTGFLSQLERGLTTIAVDSLDTIAKVLDVDLSFFFSVSRKGNESILRSYERTILSKNETGFIDYLLSSNLSDKELFPRLIEVLPSHSDEDVEVYHHQGEEFIYVLEGILTLYIDNQKYVLYPGDTSHISSRIGHNWANYSNKVVKVISINTPNRFKENS